MHGVLLAIDEPGGSWCHRLSRRFPGVEVDVVSCTPLGAEGMMESVRLSGTDVAGAVRWLQQGASADDVLLEDQGPGHAQLNLRMPRCPLLDAPTALGMMPHMPFRARRGRDLWLVEAGKAADLLHHLRDAGHGADVVRSGDWHPLRGRLTLRQREVLAAAVKAGYYASPRRATLTRLARELTIAKSTLSETLIAIEALLAEEHEDSLEAPALPDSVGWGRKRSRRS